MSRAGAWVLMALIRTYQAVISPWVTQQCKYYPSCSAYGLEAVRVHGAVRGLRLTIWRVLRCNPWSDGGVDHVPAPVGAAAVTSGAAEPAIHTHHDGDDHPALGETVSTANYLARI